MILHGITVENWRCLVGETTLGPFSEGLNILHAPNATGKSTLFEALRCALMDNHGTQGEEVQQLRPWGRELSPRVMVEFSAKGCRYRVRKRFLDRPESLLERMEGQTYRPLAEGPKADSAIRELFSSNAPRKGMSRPEHWGIQQVLWTPQGKLELDGLSGDLLASIRQALSIQVVHGGIRAVEEELKARYGAYFTPTGRLRTGSGASALPSLEESIRGKERELESKRAEYEETETLSKGVKALASRLGELREEGERSVEALKQLEKKSSEYASYLSELEKAEAEGKAAESEYLRLKALLGQMEDIRGEMGETEEKAANLRKALPELEEDLKVCTKNLETAREAFAEARKRKDDGEALLARARECRRLASLQEKIRKESETLEEARRAKEEIERAEREGAGRTFPGREEIQRIRRAFEIFEEARIMLDASMITLEITPEAYFRARVDSGENPGPASLEPGGITRVKGAPEVCLEIESFGKIRAFGPCERAGEVRTTFEEARSSLSELTGPYGINGREELEDLYMKGSELARRSENEKTRLAALLGRDSLESLEERIAKGQRDAQEILARFPEWRESPQDPSELDEEALAQRAAAMERAASAETARDGAQAMAAEKERERDRVRHTLQSLEERQEALREKLRILEGDGKSPEEREGELSALFNRWDIFRARGEEYKKLLAAFDENPVELLRRTREEERKLSEALHEVQMALAKEETRLEIASGKGLYSVIAGLEEELEDLRRTCRGEKIAADSIRLLWDTYGACRKELAETVNRIVEERATEIIGRIAGRRKGRLLLNDGMAPSAFIPEETGEDVALRTLSGGEREQVHFAVRLALAEAAGSGERQLLVLDDILMATDTLRFPRILEILEETAENLQILIITCQPDRFSSLAEARRFNLEALKG